MISRGCPICASQLAKSVRLALAADVARPISDSSQDSSPVRTTRATFSFTRRGSRQLPTPFDTGRSPASGEWWLTCALICKPAQSDIKTEGFRSLREGELVEFGLELTTDGREKAVNVTGPGGNYVQARAQL